MSKFRYSTSFKSISILTSIHICIYQLVIFLNLFRKFIDGQDELGIRQSDTILRLIFFKLSSVWLLRREIC